MNPWNTQCLRLLGGAGEMHLLNCSLYEGLTKPLFFIVLNRGIMHFFGSSNNKSGVAQL